jgi:hypothetical protein
MLKNIFHKCLVDENADKILSQVEKGMLHLPTPTEDEQEALDKLIEEGILQFLVDMPGHYARNVTIPPIGKKEAIIDGVIGLAMWAIIIAGIMFIF